MEVELVAIIIITIITQLVEPTAIIMTHDNDNNVLVGDDAVEVELVAALQAAAGDQVLSVFYL